MEGKSGYPHPPPYEAQQQSSMYPPQQPMYQPQSSMYPPVQHGMHQQQHQHQYPPQNVHHMSPIMVENPTTIIVAPQVGPEPTMVSCPSCRNTIVTRLEFESTTKTHLFAALLCLFGCWPCVCIPYCVDSCRNANHYCPSCGSFIGTYSN